MADLQREARWLADRFEQPLVRTPGAAGILNAMSPSTVWVHSHDVDVTALLAEIDGCRPRPHLMLPPGMPRAARQLHAAGWRRGQDVHQVRAERTAVDGHPVTAGGTFTRPADRQDLDMLRSLHAAAFQVTDPDEYLPASILELADVKVYVAVHPQRPRDLLASAGLRTRHAGGLLFGLAVTPDLQDSGLATAMLQNCLHVAAAQGLDFLVAEVEAPPSELWQRAGFHTTSRWQRWESAQE